MGVRLWLSFFVTSVLAEFVVAYLSKRLLPIVCDGLVIAVHVNKCIMKSLDCYV